MRRQLDNVVITRKAEGTALLELEHYKMDNDRLISLLSQTDKFENFGKFAADSGTSVRHMSPTHETKRIHNPKAEAKLKDFKDPEKELEDWIPEEAF